MYQDLRDRNSVFSGVIARGGMQMNVSYGDQTERVSGELVSGNFFEVLGVRPWAGRLFTQEDDQTPGAHPVAVLSYRFWESRFNKDPEPHRQDDPRKRKASHCSGCNSTGLLRLEPLKTIPTCVCL